MKILIIVIIIFLAPLDSHAVKPAPSTDGITISISSSILGSPYQIVEATRLCKTQYGDSAFVPNTEQLLAVIAHGQEDQLVAEILEPVDGFILKVTELRGSSDSTAFDIY